MFIVLDFFVKSTGTGHVNLSWLARLPILSDTCDPRIRNALRIRALRLCCLTSHYADLWRKICTGESPPSTSPDHPDCAATPGTPAAPPVGTPLLMPETPSPPAARIRLAAPETPRCPAGTRLATPAARSPRTNDPATPSALPTGTPSVTPAARRRRTNRPATPTLLPADTLLVTPEARRRRTNRPAPPTTAPTPRNPGPPDEACSATDRWRERLRLARASDAQPRNGPCRHSRWAAVRHPRKNSVRCRFESAAVGCPAGDSVCRASATARRRPPRFTVN